MSTAVAASQGAFMPQRIWEPLGPPLLGPPRDVEEPTRVVAGHLPAVTGVRSLTAEEHPAMERPPGSMEVRSLIVAERQGMAVPPQATAGLRPDMQEHSLVVAGQAPRGMAGLRLATPEHSLAGVELRLVTEARPPVTEAGPPATEGRR